MNALITKVIFNNPATIVFWNDNTKTVVKANKDDVFDAETGLAMAITKKMCNNIHWKNVFQIITTDDKVKGKINRRKLGDDRTIALCYARAYYHNDINWYKKFSAWLPKEKQVDNHGNGDWKETNPESETYIAAPPVLSAEPTLNDKIIVMFNAGRSINSISKETGISAYYIKKYIDTATTPKANKGKANRIIKAALKPNRTRASYTVRTQIDFPKYLDKNTCEEILAQTKEKYKDKPKSHCMSELQRLFIAECKKYYISTHYGHGYDMYAIAKTLGTNASAVQKIWNAIKRGE